MPDTPQFSDPDFYLVSMQEMFNVIDFNNNRELDWREWHNFISKEVHAGED